MRITKNPEAARLLRTFAILGFLLSFLALGLSRTSLTFLRQNIARSNAAVVGAAVAAAPVAEKEIVRQVLAADMTTARRGQAVLAKYGIDYHYFPSGTALLPAVFRLNNVFFLGLVFVAGAAFALTVLHFLTSQYEQIRAVAVYAGKVAGGDFSLDIRDNAEGDISLLKNEIYKITTMLKTQAEALQHEKTALTVALADISHQLKTPLTSLFMLNDLMSGDPDPEIRAEFLNRMKSQLERIEWLVASLLKLAKFDAGTVVLKKEPVSLPALAEEALAALAIPIEIKEVQVSITGDEQSEFVGDMNWTREALVNILKNCLEHTSERGRIEISYGENPLFAEIKVRDNGDGIAREDLPYIFNRFYKGRNAGPDSVGIGLAMAQAIVAGQGGDITVRSEAGIGTEFTLKFYKGV